MENLQPTLYECLKMVELTGGVTATESEFNYILEGMVVREKHTLKKMSKDILNKPIFQLLHDWLICDRIDYQMNKQHVLAITAGYLRRYKDIFAVSITDLCPVPAQKVKVVEEIKETKRGRKKRHGKIMS